MSLSLEGNKKRPCDVVAAYKNNIAPPISHVFDFSTHLILAQQFQI